MTDMREETMVERVARAIHAAFNDSGAADHTYAWDDPLAGRDHFRLLARAAIEAMREPTGAVMEAFLDEETPFICRRNKANASGKQHEVVKATNDDWREVVPDEHEVVGLFATELEAQEVYWDAVAAWRWNAMIDAALSEPQERG